MTSVFERIIHKIEAGATHLEVTLKHDLDDAGNAVRTSLVGVRTHAEQGLVDIVSKEAAALGYDLVKKPATQAA